MIMIIIFKCTKLGVVVAGACNPRAWKSEAGESP